MNCIHKHINQFDKLYSRFSCEHVLLHLFTEPLDINISVLVEDYVTYNLQLSDVWSVRGSTAVFKCIINPYFVKDYIHVVGWSKGTKAIQTGAHAFT